MTFRQRLSAWIWLCLIQLTQGFFNTVCAGAVWVFTGKYSAPNPDECFSSRVGRKAAQGDELGLFLQHFIDMLLGDGHCARSWANRS